MSKLSTYLLVAPLVLILLVFFCLPLVAVGILSLMGFDGFTVINEVTLDNYKELLGSSVTWRLYAETFRYVLIVWVLTTIIGLAISNFLVFHVKSLVVQIALLLLCTIPFWTSSIIRMISWLPILGREGIVNDVLMSMGLINQPIDGLMFSSFAVVVVYIHSFSLFMIVPIFNSMVKIDPSVIEAATEAGATRWQVMWNVIIPLSKSGIALGSIFIVALVMGDFFMVRVMGGGQKSSVAMAISNQIGSFQYPQAAASSIVFLSIILVVIAAILRVVDVRKEVLR